MTMLDPMLRKWSRHTWKRCNGKSYPTRCILQTLLPRIITCFDQWQTAWLASTSGLMKKLKIGSIRGSLQKMTSFFNAGFVRCTKHGRK
ncbi:hypothetical protein TNCV_4730061 [Trichonephila clavipes]|nr:hypothetical protein TNCV_4730061 [Trichonephila clavipes]